MRADGTLLEQFNRVSNTIISAINAQQELLNTTMGSDTKRSNGIVFEVKVGKTLDGIAAKFKVTRDQTRTRNLIVDENHLAVGQMLFIPQVE